MKSLISLQKDLGDQIDEIKKANLTDMKGADRELVFQKADAIAKIAKQMINVADILVRTEKMEKVSTNLKDIIG